MQRTKSCLCLVGWHSNPALLDQLAHVLGLDIFLVSHRRRDQVPGAVIDRLSPDQIFIAPNIGYDWGAYQQFLDSRLWVDYDYLFFAHDDISLLDPGVFPACQEIIQVHNAGDCIVGNGRQSARRDYPRTHIQCYAHSHWKPPCWDFEHDVVRGSFFATSAQAMHKIQRFEVLWDRHGWMGVGAGNWSLRATCGRIQAALGEDCFHYLSQEYRSSPYILEQERGDAGRLHKRPSMAWSLRYRLTLAFSRWLMTRYMNGDPATKARLARIMEQLASWY